MKVEGTKGCPQNDWKIWGILINEGLRGSEAHQHRAWGGGTRLGWTTRVLCSMSQRFYMTGALGRRSFWCQFSKRVNQRVFITFLRKLLKKRKKFCFCWTMHGGTDGRRWKRGLRRTDTGWSSCSFCHTRPSSTLLSRAGETSKKNSGTNSFTPQGEWSAWSKRRIFSRTKCSNIYVLS